MAEVATKGLGEVEGLCACYTQKTLNGRGYSQIYKRILNGEDFRYNEMMRRGGILCELGHPNQYAADFERTETDPEKACAIITEVKEREDGKIFAKATILDTPAGRIYKAIAPFYTFGFSSRGSYEVDEDSTEGPDGWNEDTYIFKGFDIVPLPATQGSEISATESLGGRRRKSARESLDLNNIADATNLDPEEVDAELDKLFAKDGSIAPAEYVNARDFVEERTTTGQSKADNLVLDLHKVLSDKSDLEKQIQKLIFEKAESDASIVSLNAQVDKLKKEIETAQSQISFYVKNKEEIQELLSKLIETHEGAVAQADIELANEVQKTESLAAQVAKLQQQVSQATDEASHLYEQASREADTASKLTTAQEELKSLRADKKHLAAELASTKATAAEQIKQSKQAAAEAIQQATRYKKLALSAREALIDTYSTIYSIDKSALAAKVGKSADIALIKSAAESLNNDALRLSTYSVPATSRTTVLSEATESFQPMDEVEKELFEALKREGRNS